MKAVLAPLAALALSACTVAASSFSASSAAATIPFAGVATVGPVRIRPLAVIEDSRCPANVQCVWAGRLRITAEIAYRGRSDTRELVLGTPISFNEGTLTLSEAQPAPVAGQRIEPAAYRLTFTFLSTR